MTKLRSRRGLSRSESQKPNRWLTLLIICLFIATFESITHATEEKDLAQPETLPKKVSSSEEQWGVRVIGIRLTANDYMLDFRYRVINPENAWHIVQKQVKPYLIDQATGKKLSVQQTRLGPMRQTAVKPAIRDYTILFANTGKRVKRGDKVTVVIGEFKAENLVVE